MAKGRVFIVDLETLGLHYLNDPVIEAGISIRDLNLTELDRFHTLIWDDPYYEILREQHHDKDSVVWNMHLESGLWQDAFENGVESNDAEIAMHEWLDKNEVNPKEDYLAGSSVHFDSTMLFFNFNSVRERFHHRVIDTSSIKVMSEIWYPNMAAQLKRDTEPKKAHRVMSDIDDTVEELRWYLDNFLPETDGPPYA